MARVIYIRERLLESLAKDTYTYGGMFALWYLNHRFTDGSWVIDIVVAAMVLISVVGRATKRYSPKEAVEVLRELTGKEEAAL